MMIQTIRISSYTKVLVCDNLTMASRRPAIDVNLMMTELYNVNE